MPFTSNGYEARRFTTILENIRQQLETRLGTSISSDPDSIIGIINSIVGNQLAISENDIQALSNSLDILKAEGVYLDRLVRFIGLTRLSAQPARGLLKVTRNSNSPINSSVRFSDDAGIEYICSSIQTSETQCNRVLLRPVTVTTGISFSLTINGAVFTKVATASDTAATIVNDFLSEINSVLGITVNNVNDQLEIVLPDEELNNINVSSFNNFTLREITAFNNCESIESRFLQVSPNTITNLISSNSSILSSTNPLDFVSGRNLETDEELRARYEISFANAGNSTFDNILAELLQLPNVTDAFIIENDSLVEVNGLPPKSYSCVVVNGDPINIANKIWETKPVGIETHGSIVSTVKDIKGNSQSVEWDRPEEVFVFVEVTFSKYDEESFPSNGNALIREAVLNYGQQLTLGVDVIPERFIGDIYRNVSGIDGISIRVGITTDINDTSPVGGYQNTRIPISNQQLPVFTSAKIELVEV